MKNKLNKWFGKTNLPIITVLTILLITSIIFNFSNTGTLQRQISESDKKIEEVSMKYEEELQILNEALIRVQDETNSIAASLQDELRESSEILENISGTVDDLEKLSETDPELLQKYSKVYFLNENYIPKGLDFIDSKYTWDQGRDYELLTKVIDNLEELMDDAEDDGMDLRVISAYRDFNTQAQLKSNYTVLYGVGTANQFSADQGYSEHQLGTTVDFTTPEVGSSFTGFENTEEYKWLLDNAHDYGFTLTYPPNNNYYQYEPWHWRYVGVKLAKDLKEEGQFMYDLTQRRLDSYLADFF
jgi:LAS superfamily LD-carboxypeptidase LdcB